MFAVICLQTGNTVLSVLHPWWSVCCRVSNYRTWRHHFNYKISRWNVSQRHFRWDINHTAVKSVFILTRQCSVFIMSWCAHENITLTSKKKGVSHWKWVKEAAWLSRNMSIFLKSVSVCIRLWIKWKHFQNETSCALCCVYFFASRCLFYVEIQSIQSVAGPAEKTGGFKMCLSWAIFSQIESNKM